MGYMASVPEGFAWRAQNLFTHNEAGDQKRARTPVHCQCPCRTLENPFPLKCTDQHKWEQNPVTPISGLSIHTAFQQKNTNRTNLTRPRKLTRRQNISPKTNL